MNKQFEYGGEKFNIGVELDVRVERTPDGKRYHRVTTNNLGQGGNFYKKDEVETSQLPDYVHKTMEEAKNWIDGRSNPKSKVESMLGYLGFK